MSFEKVQELLGGRKEEFFHNLIHTAGDAWIVLDETLHINLFNQKAEALFGFKAVDVLGQPFGLLFAQERRASVERDLMGMLQAASFGAQGSVVWECLTHDGDRFLSDVSLSTLDADGKQVLSAIMRKKATRAPGPSIHTEKAAKSPRERESHSQELRNFLYIVTHDLRSPLVNLKGFAGELELALDELRTLFAGAAPALEQKQQERLQMLLAKELPEALDFIHTSTSRMDDLINALLKLARLGRRGLHFSQVPLQEVVEEALASLAHQLEQSQTRVDIQPLATVFADRFSVEQVIGNLLSNAVKYLDPQRPGEIEAFMVEPEDEDEASDAVLCIRDNGRGIEASQLPKIFQVFQRVGGQDIPGDGMGLSYAQAMIKRHGGQVWCESTPGVGSSFFVSFPHHPIEREL